VIGQFHSLIPQIEDTVGLKFVLERSRQSGRLGVPFKQSLPIGRLCFGNGSAVNLGDRSTNAALVEEDDVSFLAHRGKAIDQFSIAAIFGGICLLNF
jgi:hypothetical protein